MIEFLKEAAFSGYGVDRTPWRNWEAGMEPSLLVSDLLQRGANDFFECSLEVEQPEGMSRTITPTTSLAHVGQRIDRVEIAKPGRLHLHFQWSISQIVGVSVALHAVPPSPGDASAPS